MYFPINDQLSLKILRPEDASEIFQLTDKNREHLREWLPWVDNTKSDKDTLAFIQSTMKQFSENNGVQCSILKNDKIVGVIGQHKINWANKSVVIGYWLAKDYEGQGIVTLATKAMVDYSFSNLNLNLVEISVATENSKSMAIPKRLGFRKEGVLRQREWLYDHYVDHEIYSLLKSEWSENN